MSLVTYNLPGGFNTPLAASVITANPSSTVFVIDCGFGEANDYCGDNVATWTIGPWAEMTPSVTTGVLDVTFTASSASTAADTYDGAATATAGIESVEGSMHCEITGSVAAVCTETAMGVTATVSVASYPELDLSPVTLSVTAGAEMLTSAGSRSTSSGGASSSTSAAAKTGASSAGARTTGGVTPAAASASGSKTTAGSSSSTSAAASASSSGSKANAASAGKGVKLATVGMLGLVGAMMVL